MVGDATGAQDSGAGIARSSMGNTKRMKGYQVSSLLYAPVEVIWGPGKLRSGHFVLEMEGDPFRLSPHSLGGEGSQFPLNTSLRSGCTNWLFGCVQVGLMFSCS